MRHQRLCQIRDPKDLIPLPLEAVRGDVEQTLGKELKGESCELEVLGQQQDLEEFIKDGEMPGQGQGFGLCGSEKAGKQRPEGSPGFTGEEVCESVVDEIVCQEEELVFRVLGALQEGDELFGVVVFEGGFKPRDLQNA